MCGPIQRLPNALHLAYAADRGGYPLVPQRELQGSSTWGYLMLRAQLFNSSDLFQYIGGCSLINIIRIFGRAFRQDTAAIGCRVQNRNALPLGIVNHGSGVAIGEGKSIVGDQRVEVPIA